MATELPSAPAPGTPPPVARAAASVIVLRDAPAGSPAESAGLQVLLLKRAERPGDQNSGAAVFPGGMLDAADRGHYGRCAGLDDAAASARLGVAEHGLHYWVAALRECFEEAGLLYAHGAAGALGKADTDGPPVDLDAQDPAALDALRRELHAGALDLEQVCERLGVNLAPARLRYCAHWITPKGMPKIFDTRFFIAALPPRQTARHDATETVDLLWLTPAQALAPERGLKLLNVTERVLQQLSRFASVAEALAWADAQTEVPLNRPRIGVGPKGRTPCNADHWAYAELGRVDPEGHGKHRVDLAPGIPAWLGPRILRMTAPNGSMMTGPGTNSYFVGAPGSDDWTLLDPGPDDAGHVRALLAAAPGRITRIVVTHTHKDHSPAAAAIAAATGAPTFGRVAAHPEWQDTAFRPDHVLADGDVLALGEGVTLRAVHTPGHASNHLCFLLPEEKLLFTGDHLMQGSTVVINPPDGDMAVYLASLEKLLALDIEWLAPGHGFLIERPHEVVRKTIAHRQAREAKVLAAVRALGPAPEEALLAQVYADTPKHLHAVALRSLRAHLGKLRDEGAARLDDGRWSART